MSYSGLLFVTENSLYVYSFFYVYTLQPAVCLLTLFGTGGDTFIPLSFLDQILSADFFQKFPNFLGRENLH